MKRNIYSWRSCQHKQPRQKFCPAYSKRCNNAGKDGHFARVCKSIGIDSGRAVSRKSYMKTQMQHANQVELEDVYSNEELCITDHNKNKKDNTNG